jgi:hypothetical protein
MAALGWSRDDVPDYLVLVGVMTRAGRNELHLMLG